MSEQNQKSKNETPLLELVISIMGFLMVFAVVTYLLYGEVAQTDTPPNIRIEQTNVVRVDNGYLVQLQVTNLGNESAASVTIEGTLSDNSEPLETAEVTIDYIAGESNNELGLFFTHDPSNTHLNSAHWGIKPLRNIPLCCRCPKS